MAATLLLNRDGWDLTITARGDIAVATEPYSQMQDAASAARVFEQEVFYDTTLGLPYFGHILGHFQPVQVFKAKAIEAAMTVPGVKSAKVYLTAFSKRQISGQLQIETDHGVHGVSF